MRVSGVPRGEEKLDDDAAAGVTTGRRIRDPGCDQRLRAASVAIFSPIRLIFMSLSRFSLSQYGLVISLKA